MLATEVGVVQADMAADRTARMRGIDEASIQGRLHRFGTLEVGDETLNNFRLGVAASNIDTMLLGDDFLRFNHVWISYPLQTLYVRPVIPAALAPAGH